MVLSFVIVEWLIMLFALAAFLAPAVIVASMSRTRGGLKAVWVGVTLLGSWLALIAYLLAYPAAAAPRINAQRESHG